MMGRPLAILFAALLVLSGCSADRAGAPTATQGSTTGVGAGSAPSPTPAPATDDRTAIAAAYEQFWRQLHDVAGKPDSEWRRELGEVATDPQLSTTLQGLGLLRQQSLTLYGQETARVSSVEVDGDRATLVDCQDGSTAGQAETPSGKRKTVGIARNPVTTSLVRGPDRRWRVSEIKYPGGEC
jgi:hypothetical protein